MEPTAAQTTTGQLLNLSRWSFLIVTSMTSLASFRRWSKPLHLDQRGSSLEIRLRFWETVPKKAAPPRKRVTDQAVHRRNRPWSRLNLLPRRRYRLWWDRILPNRSSSPTRHSGSLCKLWRTASLRMMEVVVPGKQVNCTMNWVIDRREKVSITTASAGRQVLPNLQTKRSLQIGLIAFPQVMEISSRKELVIIKDGTISRSITFSRGSWTTRREDPKTHLGQEIKLILQVSKISIHLRRESWRWQKTSVSFLMKWSRWTRNTRRSRKLKRETRLRLCQLLRPFHLRDRFIQEWLKVLSATQPNWTQILWSISISRMSTNLRIKAIKIKILLINN